MKDLKQSDVTEVALQLIKDNLSTTNLDIKQELRGQGFWATQREVSNLMLTIVEDENRTFKLMHNDLSDNLHYYFRINDEFNNEFSEKYKEDN